MQYIHCKTLQYLKCNKECYLLIKLSKTLKSKRAKIGEQLFFGAVFTIFLRNELSVLTFFH